MVIYKLVSGLKSLNTRVLIMTQALIGDAAARRCPCLIHTMHNMFRIK